MRGTNVPSMRSTKWLAMGLQPHGAGLAAGMSSTRSAPSESGTPGHVFSLAETARMFHRDNYGSTAATVGNSTTFGGSDAGTGAALMCSGALTMFALCIMPPLCWSALSITVHLSARLRNI